MQEQKNRIAAVLPCYKSKAHVLDVIAGFGPEITNIIVVDDACPIGTGRYVSENCTDPRLVVVTHEVNKGVGGAVVTGYRKALELGADIMVKIDSDGQMDPAFIPTLVKPLARGIADYSKGNRFFNPEDVSAMPRARKFGNAGLSFLTKISSGYWNVFDPTNGFTAIHRAALMLLPLEKLSERYFFESDLLFRLNTIRAVVVDVPMRAFYGDEESHLNVRKALFDFSWRHLKTVTKRVAYMYFLRDFSVASLHLVFGTILTVFGVILGAISWYDSSTHGQVATAGTVMLSALPIILGFQMLLAFLTYDYAATPRIPLQMTSNFP